MEDPRRRENERAAGNSFLPLSYKIKYFPAAILQKKYLFAAILHSRVKKYFPAAILHSRARKIFFCRFWTFVHFLIEKVENNRIFGQKIWKMAHSRAPEGAMGGGSHCRFGRRMRTRVKVGQKRALKLVFLCPRRVAVTDPLAGGCRSIFFHGCCLRNVK